MVAAIALASLLALTIAPPRAIAAEPAPDPSADTCPTEIEPLVRAMLPELPGYINRILRRSRTVTDPRGDRAPASYVLLAGQPDFEPLPLNRTPPEGVQQVFLTTLERTYGDRQYQELQYFHWFFLSQNAEGWWLVSAFSSLGGYPESGVVTPPRESSQGAVARAVQTWLRDCRARRPELTAQP